MSQSSVDTERTVLERAAAGRNGKNHGKIFPQETKADMIIQVALSSKYDKDMIPTISKNYFAVFLISS